MLISNVKKGVLAGKPLVWWQRMVFYALAVLLPFSIEVSFAAGHMLMLPSELLVGIGLALLVWDVLIFRKAWKSFFSKELLWAIPLLLAFMITTAFSENLVVSVKSALKQSAYFLVFYVLMSRVLASYPKLFYRLVGLYALGLFIVFVMAVYRFGNYNWNILTVRGLYEPFYNDHTIFGAAAALISAYFLAMRGSRHRVFGLVFLVAVFFSTSRAAILSMGVFVFFVFAARSRFRMYLFLAATFIFLIASGVYVGSIREKISSSGRDSAEFGWQSTGRSFTPASALSDVSAMERTNRWVAAWRMFKERPVTGFGPGTYQFQYIPYQDPAFVNRLTVLDSAHIPEGSGGTAHSEYLLIAAEMGVIGLIAFLLITGRWLLLFKQTLPSTTPGKYIILAVASLSTYMFHGLFNNFLTTDKFAFLFWSFGALIIASKHWGKMNNQEKNQII